MNLKQREAKEARQETNKIKAGDSVIIASRFFVNHGLPIKDMGIGYIVSIEAPYFWIMFISNSVRDNLFQKYIELGYLSEIDIKNDVRDYSYIKIHSVYIEKINVKKVKKAKKKHA